MKIRIPWQLTPPFDRSVFYNDLFAFDMERRRWFRLALKKSAKKGRDKGKGKQAGGGSAQVIGRLSSLLLVCFCFLWGVFVPRFVFFVFRSFLRFSFFVFRHRLGLGLVFCLSSCV